MGCGGIRFRKYKVRYGFHLYEYFEPEKGGEYAKRS